MEVSELNGFVGFIVGSVCKQFARAYELSMFGFDAD
jgi:hypothetical protein